ncbi:hypothetical protein FNV43_RR21555 [Rhamnella rubrinervis]|uniref:Cytochrome P450 71A1 n=1 Tax=Rhamnella rubrinervis TaxID=2594499 RepID=A0A8K0GXR9_9ROSA|nr:hypothetical protein FNV43_RR21555 [Rhamnella rubrinervis]
MALLPQLNQLWNILNMTNTSPLDYPFLVSLLLASLLLLLIRRRSSGLKHNLPPSPPKLPLIGNLHYLGSLPHRSLRELARKYGHDLMLLHLGQTPTLVVSSAEMLRQILKSHDSIFSNRPKTTANSILLYGCRDVGFSPYGEYWRQVRKVSVVELLSMKRVLQFQFVRDEEVSVMLNRIRKACADGASINLSDVFIAISNNIVSRCVLGDCYEEENGTSRLGELGRMVTIHLLEFSVGDFFPYMGWIDVDMFLGGSDTTSTTLEWLMAELIKHPNVMKKLQEEVRRVVGQKTNIEMNDINKMEYLNCVIKETLRLHPPAPLLLPRETRKNIEMGGYHIPAKTRVFINAWAIQRDPRLWDRPEEFIPERFQNNSVDYRSQDLQFVPFGLGRRGCPGMSFALASTEFVIANVLYWFDWKLPEDGVLGEKNMDMTEAFGLAVHKKFPLHLKPIPYSNSA